MTSMLKDIGNKPPDSSFSLECPDLWRDCLTAAELVTGREFHNKAPNEHGIWACGGGGGVSRSEPPSKEEINERKRKQKEQREEREKEIEREERDKQDILDKGPRIEPEVDKAIKDILFVPEGATEWLAHEIGHCLATDVVRPDHGLLGDDDEMSAEQEWKAMAFEEILFYPWAPSRVLMAPSYRGGIPFSKDSIPHSSMNEMEKIIKTQKWGIEMLRKSFGAWAKWELSRLDRNEIFH